MMGLLCVANLSFIMFQSARRGEPPPCKTPLAGSSQKTLSLRAIKESFVPDPPSIERDMITERLTSISDRIDREEKALLNRVTVKTGLMQDLLTGRVRVKLDEGNGDV